jgi:mono/diheme cytochrome c family protein
MAKWDGARLWRWTRLALLAAVAAALALTAGCGDSESKSTTNASPPRRVVQVEQVKRDRWTYARARFNELCAGCHSLADAGATGRRFHLDHTVDLDETRVRWVIAEGEPGMPAYRGVLSKREYEELVAYVSTVDRHTPGDDYYKWQLKLRTDGENWSPEDAR